MSARGIPVQDLPENQDPEVAHRVDWLTGEKVPLEVEEAEEAEESDEDEKPKRKGKSRKAIPAPSEKAADPTSFRETGS